MPRLLTAFILLAFSSLLPAQLPEAWEDPLPPRYESEFDIVKEEPGNPLVLIDTSMGQIVVELFPREAPATVESFVGLATGRKAFTDPETREPVQRAFYDGLVFHRVIEGFMIQGGSATGRGDGSPGFVLDDEINARSLGLDRIPAMDEEGYPHASLGIGSQRDFQRRLLEPLYLRMGINNQEDLEARADEVMERIQGLTLMEAYELQGYTYTERFQSRAPVPGVIAMANRGPNSAGAQFFITTGDTPWLLGKFTVFGKVRQGLDVAEAISMVETDRSDRPVEPVVIHSIRPLQP